MFKVAGKMFALTRARPPRRRSRSASSASRRSPIALRGSYAAIRPGYHLNKRHWNTITLDGSLPDQLVRDLIEDSYDLVVSALPAAHPQPARLAGRGLSASAGPARTSISAATSSTSGTASGVVR